MRIGFAALLLIMSSLTFGCGGAARTSKGESAQRYTDKELQTSFRIPPRWTEPSSWNPVQRAPWAARFDAPADGVVLVLGAAPYASIDCAAAARAALRAATGSSLAGERQFSLKLRDGELPAGDGFTAVGDRQGRARFFCHGQTAVVLEISAPRATFTKHQGEIESILDSMSFDAAEQDVAIRAPIATPPAPTFFIHEVKFRGQTLGQIAEWYTGSFDNWRKLARANDIPVPNVALKVGREVKIPSELVVRQDPLPEPKRKHVVRSAPPRRTAKEPAEAPEASEEAPALPPVIGPR
jgi:hypothetical protein